MLKTLVKDYSQIAVAIDLISSEFKTCNPVLISEMIQTELGLDYTIHQIVDYIDINKMENYEKISNEVNYQRQTN